MSVARDFANYALELKYDDLPAEVVHKAKRVLLDTIACAIGGSSCETVGILRQVIAQELQGAKEATVLGDGARTTALNATLINGAMVRFLDANDIYFAPDIPGPRGGHPSEIIPPIIAVGERQRASGKEMLTAVVAGYELSGRFLEAIKGPTLEERGWNMDLRGGFIVPPVVGRLLGLTEEQIENAIGIAGTRSMLLGIMDEPTEQNTLAKNLRFPLTACTSIVATYMAKHGLTGPGRAVEGKHGFVDSVLNGDFDMERVNKPLEKYRIMYAGTKGPSACYSTHGHLQATLELVKEYDIKPDDVAAVMLTTTPRSKHHTGDPLRKHPVNKETADHSSYYVTAMAIMERAMGPDQYDPNKYNDPQVKELMEKVTIEADPALNEYYPAAVAEITTKSGKTYARKVLHPHGHPLDPMTDQEIQEKFHSMAHRHMGDTQIKEVIDAIYNFDSFNDVNEFMKLLAFKGR